jgi:hypothetical protein
MHGNTQLKNNIAVLLGYFLGKTQIVEEKNINSSQENEMLLLNSVVERRQRLRK